VLKNPSHLFAVQALLQVYPDALIIQTHREPRTAISSSCSLSAQATAGWSEKFTGRVLGQDQLELWSRGLDIFTTERAKHDPAQFCDVAYADFVTDPLGTVNSIYADFGLPLTEQARAAMQAIHAVSTSGGRRPAHRYSLADFGLTDADVDERFPR